MYKVTDMSGKIVIATANTERAAVASGRRHEREVSALGGCAEGFRVYDASESVIREQTCDNFGNHWKEL